MKILWCITGAGHLLLESVSFIAKHAKRNEITVALSHAGTEVADTYSLSEKITKEIAKETIIEKNAQEKLPILFGKLIKREFDKIIVMPCTANTVAKIAHGISDSLVTNMVAQALKNQIPVIIFPTDFKKNEETTLPDKKKAKIHVRTVDISNVRKIASMEGIKVVRNFEEIEF